MAKYRVTIDKKRCTDCGIAVGRCPTHAIQLSRLLKKNQEHVHMGVFFEPLYDRIKQLVEACPAKAIVIEKIEE
jgi:ferredoxin